MQSSSSNAALSLIQDADNQNGAGLLPLTIKDLSGDSVMVSDQAWICLLYTSKTAVQILRDMNGIINSVSKQTNDVENPNTLVLPPDQYNYIASTPYSDAVSYTHLCT